MPVIKQIFTDRFKVLVLGKGLFYAHGCPFKVVG